MKKVLSIILVLSMLIMPVKMSFCFADGARKDTSQSFEDVLRIMKSRGLVKIVTVVNVDDKGNFTIRLDFWGQKKRFLGAHVLSKDNKMYERFEKQIENNHVRETMKSLNCSRALLVAIPYSYIITANFYDKDRKIVKIEYYPYKLFDF